MIGEVVHQRRLRRPLGRSAAASTTPHPLVLSRRAALRIPVVFILCEAGHPQQVRRRRVQVRGRARRQHRECQAVRVDAAAVHVQHRVPQHERHHRVRHEVSGVDTGGRRLRLAPARLVTPQRQRRDPRQALRTPARGAVQRTHDALQNNEQVAQLRVGHFLGPVRAVAGHHAAEGAAEGAAAAGGWAVQHDGFGGGVEGGAEVGAQVRVAVEGREPAQAFGPRDGFVRHAVRVWCVCVCVCVCGRGGGALRRRSHDIPVILQLHQEVITQPFGGRLLAHANGALLAASNERRMMECTTGASSMCLLCIKSHAAPRILSCWGVGESRARGHQTAGTEGSQAAVVVLPFARIRTKETCMKNRLLNHAVVAGVTRLRTHRI